MRTLRTLLAQHGVKLNLASETQCRNAVEGQILRASYHRLDLNSGAKKDGATTEALLYVVEDACELVARDLDLLIQNGNFEQRCFPCDVTVHDRPVIHIAFSEDKGGASSKFCLRCLDCKTPCSYKACSICASYEATKIEDKPPVDDYENFRRILSLIPSVQSLTNFSVVKIGKCHCLVPKSAVAGFLKGDIPVAQSELTKEEADILFAASKAPTGTPEEREERRAEVEVFIDVPSNLILFLTFLMAGRFGLDCSSQGGLLRHHDEWRPIFPFSRDDSSCSRGQGRGYF